MLGHIYSFTMTDAADRSVFLSLVYFYYFCASHVTHLLFSISGSGRCSVGCRQLIDNVGSCKTRRAASADTPTAPSTEEVRTRSPRGPTNPGNPV